MYLRRERRVTDGDYICTIDYLFPLQTPELKHWKQNHKQSRKRFMEIEIYKW